jgi:NAD(P)-dependent dehydrogenase (short-subunit alcohol dehydrogenase family)
MPSEKPWTKKDMPALGGKLAIVTGGTGGLGYETALGLAEAGATVILAGRSDEKGKAALEKIQALVPTAAISFENADLGSLASVAEFCKRINARNQAVHILVNNAGVMMPPNRTTTSDGFELQFGTNHLSHFALTAQLLPSLRKESGARVVNVASIAHRQGKINWSDLQAEKSYSPQGTYSQSKLANLLFTLELQRRSEEGAWGLTAISAHPGLSKTELINNGPGDTLLGKASRCMVAIFSQDAANGALPTLFAAVAPEAKPAAYYGPKGFYEMKGPVAPAYLTREAKDSEAAKKLWDISVNLTGVTWP